MATRPKLAVRTPRRLREMEARLAELEETLRAIHHGEVDALVVSAPEGDRVFTLQGADQPYRVMVETINEGAATLTVNGLVLYANRRFAEMVSIPLEKLIGSNLHNIVQTLQCPTLDELLERAQTAPQKEECYLLVTGGKRLPAYLSLSPLKGPGFQGICMIATDLTEQKSRHEELMKTNELLKAEIAERERVEDLVRQTEEVFRSFMNYAPAAVFMKDEEGRYVFCNQKVAELAGIEAEGLLGRTRLDWVPGEAGRVLHERDLAALSGNGPTELIDTIPSQKGNLAELLMVRFPFRDPSGRRLLGGVGVDITLQRRAELSLRQLTGRLLSLQDEERRRIARDLHDSTAQTLTALALNLALIQRQKGMPGNLQTTKLVADSMALAEQASKEVRNLSHLLHPPDLDKVGLTAAIRWHSTRISALTGIDVTLDLPVDWGRLPEDVEIALFRILQESLENVRRHSGSPVAKVRLIRKEGKIVLEVEDHGHGAPPGILTNADQNVAGLGVGVAGMRERLRQLGGRLEIESGSHGTTVRAIVPISEPGRAERSRSARPERPGDQSHS